MRLKTFILALSALFATIGAAYATVRIHVDLSTQTMHVDSSSGSYSWPVSTARAGYSTPRGSFAPTGLQRMHYSRKYHMSPMPYFQMVQAEGASISITGSPPGGTRYAARSNNHRNAARYAALRRAHRADAMAYAPSYAPRHYGTVRSWQAQPVAPVYYTYPPY